MSHPVPELPTNVQSTNRYTGVDRGLMILNGRYEGFARIHAARWTTHGPVMAMSLIEFQVMRYDSMPITEEDYAAGQLLNTPEGTTWFDCQGRGDCSTPIMLEYYARNILQTYYAIHDNPSLLTVERKENIRKQAVEFTKTIGRPYDVLDMAFTTAYNATATTPLAETSVLLEFTFGDPDAPIQAVLTTMEQPDPIQEMFKYIAKQRGDSNGQ